MTKITPALLSTYFQLWKEGRSSDDIRDLLFPVPALTDLEYSDPARVAWNRHAKNRSKNEFRRIQPELLYYCRNRTVEEFREGQTAGNYQHIPLTTERRVEFIDLCGSGLSVPEAAEYTGIPLPTVLDNWFVKDPLFKFEIDQIRLLQNAKVVRALYQKAVGRTYEKKSKTHTAGKGEKGLIDTESVTKTETVIEPDVKAIELWLTNRMPDQWSKDGQKPLGGNKGSILTAIEEAMGTNADAEDAEFDRAQIEYMPVAVVDCSQGQNA